MNTQRWFHPGYLALSAAVAACSLFAPRLHATPPAGYTLVWQEEFDGTALDTRYWNYTYPGVYRDAVNTPNAVSVGGGALTITTYSETVMVNNVAELIHYTGFLDTKNKYQPRYGHMEARISFVNAPGNWSAFWMYVDSVATPGNPHVNGVEMDIIEHRATGWPGSGDLSGQGNSAIHWDGYLTQHQAVGLLRGTGLQTGFHDYSMTWTPTDLYFYIDGAYVFHVVNSTETDPKKPLTPVPQRSEGFMLSTEVLDADWAGTIPSGGFGPLTGAGQSTSKMIVDYIRVYQLNPAAPAVPANVTVANVNHRQIQLSWKMSDDASYYNIKRATVSGGPYTTIATSGVGYTDDTVTDDQTYYYVISAVNGLPTTPGAPESANSAQVSATPLPANVRNGYRAAQGVLPGGTPSYGSIIQAPAVPTNTAYTAGFWLKGSGTVRFMIRPGYNGNPPLISQFINATPTWTYYSASFNTGANTQLSFYLGDASATAGTVYVDDAFMGPSPGTNLLLNPGFENGMTSWNVNLTSVWTAPHLAHVHAGLYSARGILTGTPSYFSMTKVVDVPASTSYNASFWIKGTGTVRFMVRAGNNGTPIISQFIAATPTWTQYTYPFNTAANTQVTYYLGDSSTVAGTVYIDDVYLGPPSGSGNLLPNPGFESGALGWNVNPAGASFKMDQY